MSQSEKLRIGVIGCGYWGPNIARNFARNPRSEIVALCDLDQTRADRLASEYRTPLVSHRPDDLTSSTDLDLIAIATPTGTHFQLAKSALEAGKHVFVMKPLSASAEEAEELCAIAEREGRLLAVDHTFLFTGAVRKMKELIDRGELGELYYFDSVRINLGLIQLDVNVLWDLAPHDISIMDYLIGEEPVSVAATAAAHGGSPTENIAYMSLRYEGALLGHVHVNWLAPAKIRRTIVGGSKRMLVYDDMEPSEKVKVYDKGFSMQSPDAENGYQMLISYRTGDMHAPKLDSREALAVEVENIVNAIAGHEPLMADGHAGLRVVRVLEAAQRSLDQNGATVPVRFAGALGQ